MSSSYFALTSAAILFTLLQLGTALTCYTNDADGNIFEETNSTWTYCVLRPKENGGRLYGIGPANDNTDGLDHTFGASVRGFRVLSLCVYEKYDFGKVLNMAGFKPEYLFRCFCNYDRCNKATTFSHFLQGVRSDSKVQDGDVEEK